MINWIEVETSRKGCENIGVNNNSIFISRPLFKKMGSPTKIMVGYDDEQRLILKISESGFKVLENTRYYIRICSRPLARKIAKAFGWPTQTSRYTIATKTEKQDELWIFSDWKRKTFEHEKEETK